MIYFVSETYIRENTPVNANVDIKDLLPNIKPASDMFIMPILGTNFYTTLLNSYSAMTLNANEEILVSYIKPFLAYKTIEISIPWLTYQVKNKGPQSQTGDFSSNIDNSTMYYLKKELENRSEWYSQRLVNYLCDNSSLFSGYTNNNSTDLSPDNSATYDSGIALYDNNCNNCGRCSNCRYLLK